MKEKLLQAALKARDHAHSPYSQFKVGAAVLLENGKIFSGANIENASYGATVCAERVAIWKAISEEGLQPIREIVVTTPEAWPPCGMCRQVLSEFATPLSLIHVADLQRIQRTFTLSELLPQAFTPTHLKK